MREAQQHGWVRRNRRSVGREWVPRSPSELGPYAGKGEQRAVAKHEPNDVLLLARWMGGANGSRECAPDDKLRDTHHLDAGISLLRPRS